MKAYEAVIRVLDAEDVERVFALMSEDTLHLVSALQERWAGEIDVIETRHEQGSTAMADGYSRASGDVGVCIVGRGPGIAQTGTSLVTARKRGSKVLAIVPTSPASASYDVKAFEQESFLRSTVGNVVTVRSRETLIEGVEEGFRRARAGDGPVAVQVPWDLLDGDLEVPEGFDDWGTEAPPSPGRLQPDDEGIEAAVDLYLGSDATKPPVVLAGRGAVRSGAREELEALADRTSGLLATTLQARGYFDGHPFSVGFVGEWGGTLANEYVNGADCVFAVGCSLNPHTTDEGRLFAEDAKLIQIDADPEHIGRHTPVDVGIEGDARASVDALLDELDALDIDREGELRTERMRERIAGAPALDDGEFPDEPGTMDPRDLVRTVDRILPEDRLVVTDAGHFTRWVVDGIRTPTPDDFVWTLDFASIGQGLGIGIGATLATEDRPCVTFCGDAGFMMSNQEIETAARHGVPITVVVMNDSALGSEYHNLAKSDLSGDAALVDTPDLAEVARSLGAEGYAARSVGDLEELSDVLGRIPDGPRVIDCAVNHNVRHRSKL